jgi:starch synthase (maltosyl-transferring)
VTERAHFPNDGRSRVVVERMRPEIDAGRFAAKRIRGETLLVEVDVFTDGHDMVAGALRHRGEKESTWTEVPLVPLGNDRYTASFVLGELGRHLYTVVGWIDRFSTYRRDLAKRFAAGQELSVELLSGAALVEEVAARAGTDAAALLEVARKLRDPSLSESARAGLVLDEDVGRRMRAHDPRRFLTRYPRELVVEVERERARTGAWYEMFPRSCAREPGRHGTLKDCEARLPYVASMGFDVLYLPPIHPIGRTYRKGKNNAVTAGPEDVGSPWAIGGPEGGHKAIHPSLGTAEDFRHLVARAKSLGLEVALDLALQCSPDHPYVREHPEWFLRRPDGTIQYAENPPKKYQDIYPFHFECEAWRELWSELKSIVDFWVGEGVRIFRVDNPHTKPFPFWEWLIRETRREHPDLVYLAEAFTRPKIMYELGKLGFSQSYTYFSWRTGKEELTKYMTELTRSEAADFYRPAFWPNTPDILTEQLQVGGRATFISRVILAGTLAATYGIYGPAYELLEARPRDPGSEEYLDSEKYQTHVWDIAREDSIAPVIARLNRVRRENPALSDNATLAFHRTENDQLLCYSKTSADGEDVVLMVVSLDPHHPQSGFLELDLAALGLPADQPYQVHDLLTDARFFWRGARNFVELRPDVMPAHVFRLRRRVRRENDFEYFL